ncbi:MAG TPA: MBL fold metallo-hydrolase [Pyrinomonadaceae bacterium]|nr:MBL fold metallo-hydrolase [Pyrinomonadaceae bacterium]
MKVVINILVFALTSLSAIGSLRAQQDFSKVEVTTAHLAGSVYVVQGKLEQGTVGSNIAASIGPDGVLLVDSEYLGLSGKVRAALKETAGQPPKIKFIINTHWHRDHTEGNAELGAEATIIAQTETYKLLSTKQEMFGCAVGPSPHEALPTIAFDRSLSLYFNGEEIRVIHFTNGHSSGDSVVFFTQSNVVHTGDIYIGKVFPFVDLDHGGDVEGLAANVREILSRVSPATRIIPGHRAVATPEDLRQYLQMLEESISVVKRGIAKKKTLKEIQGVGLPAQYKEWEWPALSVSGWLEYVYKSVTKKATPRAGAKRGPQRGSLAGVLSPPS